MGLLSSFLGVGVDEIRGVGCFVCAKNEEFARLIFQEREGLS